MQSILGASEANRSAHVLLVDDHAMVRSGLRLLIESVLEHRVSEADTAEEAVERAGREAYDAVLIDVQLPGHDGLWALERLRERQPETPVLVLSTFDDPDYIEAAIEGGAAGFVLKEATPPQLAEAIDTALSGRGMYLHPVAAQRMLRVRRQRDAKAATLSEREREVLELLSKGCSNEDIATRLFVTEKTVKAHLTSIFRKLGVSNRTQAATLAIKEALVET